MVPENDAQLVDVLEDATEIADNEATAQPPQKYVPRFGQYEKLILRRSNLLEKTFDAKAVASININGKFFKAIDIEDIDDFSNLKEILAAENRFDLKEFQYFTSLQTLVLSCNAIENILLSSKIFLSLKTVDLSFNQLNNEAIIELSKLQKLQVLNLMGNNITRFLPAAIIADTMDYEENQKFPELAVLNLSNNKCTGDEESWWTLSQLPKILKMSDNKISACKASIDPLILVENGYASSQFFEQLEELDLSSNQINDRSLVKRFSKCRKLKKVAIENNPLTADHEDAKTLSLAFKFKGISLLTSPQDCKLPQSPKTRHSRPSSGTFYKKMTLRTIKDVKMERVSKLSEKALIEHLCKDLEAQNNHDSNMKTAFPVKPSLIEKDAWNFAGVEIELPSMQNLEKKTFLTSLNLVEKPTSMVKKEQQEHIEPIDDILKRLLDTDKQAHIPLPGNLPQSYRALRRVVEAPPELIIIVPRNFASGKTMKTARQPRNDMDCLKSLMTALDEKLEFIDTNLVNVISNEKLKAKLPSPQSLLSEAQNQYQQLQQLLLKTSERGKKMSHP